MIGEHVIYLGRTIPKDNFRPFIYSFNNEQKLVESWEEYEANIATQAIFINFARCVINGFYQFYVGVTGNFGKTTARLG